MIKLFNKKRKKESTKNFTKTEITTMVKEILFNYINHNNNEVNQAIFYSIFSEAQPKNKEEFFKLLSQCKNSYEKIKMDCEIDELFFGGNNAD